MDLATNEMMAPSVNANCQYSTRYCWEADKVKSLIRLRAELSPLFTGKRNASKYAWAVVERELNVPLPLSKIIKKWNNLLQEYKAIKMSEEPKRREWPFFTLMDVYFSEQVNDPSLRLFSSTKTLKETIDDSVFEDDPIIASAIAAATSGAYMDIEELIRRQKERANDKKFAADDYKFSDIKPMMANNKFNHNSDIVKLSKSVDDLSMQQHKIKEEIIRQREQEQQENIVKIKQHARQQQQRFQQQQQQQAQQHSHAHHVQHHATPPPTLHTLQQHHLHQQQQHHHQQQQQREREREQQQREQQLQQAQRREQQQREQQQQQQREQSHVLHHQPPPPTPPTTAQQIHLQTAQHQAQQQLHLQQQQHQQHREQQQQQQFTDPNTIDQYLLSWNNFHGNMCRGFHTLQKDEKMVDVTIAAGGKIFKAHKLVLSVCSPYFQQIFLENPSSHPILLMADVEASHMTGLLDFMYSGQVNVKYEDLPVFLKVAEAMKIKGLHTEKNMDDDSKEMNSNQDAAESTECRFDRATHSVNITTGQGAYGGGQTQLQQQLESNMNGIGSSSTPIPVQSFSSFRDHIKSKATLAETFMKNLSRNNNNSNNSSNFNHLNNCTTNSGNSSNSNNNGNGNGNGSIVPEALNAVADNYAILHANSKKMLDTRKQQHKNWAKRKIQMYYNDELNEKRLKESIELQYGSSGGGGDQHDGNNNNNGGSINCGSGSSNCSETQEETNLAAIATAAATHQQQQQQQQQVPQHKNFKIRLLENHRSNSSEEEALNLVQNTTTTTTTTNAPSATMAATTKNDILDVDRLEIDLEKNNTNTKTDAERSNNGGNEHKKKSQEHAYTQEDNDNNNNVSNSNNNNNNDDAAQLLRKKFISAAADDNNNNNEANTDNNNNETNKNAALINAINKSLERKVQRTAEEDDNNNDSNNNNNNNNNELDLTNASIVRNIATAEILCGLKSKVIKIKREREEEEAGQQQQQCRNLSEIKNAE